MRLQDFNPKISLTFDRLIHNAFKNVNDLQNIAIVVDHDLDHKKTELVELYFLMKGEQSSDQDKYLSYGKLISFGLKREQIKDKNLNRRMRELSNFIDQHIEYIKQACCSYVEGQEAITFNVYFKEIKRLNFYISYPQ